MLRPYKVKIKIKVKVKVKVKIKVKIKIKSKAKSKATDKVKSKSRSKSADLKVGPYKTLEALEDAGCAHAAANAHGDHAVAGVAALELTDYGGG